MRLLKKLILLCCATLCALAYGQDYAKPKKIIIIEDHFFSELPVAASETTGIGIIKTPNGTRATVIRLANPLPEEALKYAIPAEQIPEADELLRRSKEARIGHLSFNREHKINVGDKFPEFSAKDIDGKVWTNADVTGKPMVLNLWFTGCGPCLSEMPELSKWKNEMPDIMFFSSTYESAETARPVLEQKGFNWIPLVNDTQFKEWIGSNGYPMTIVINKEGRITHIEYGTSPVQREKLRDKIEAVR